MRAKESGPRKAASSPALDLHSSAAITKPSAPAEDCTSHEAPKARKRGRLAALKETLASLPDGL
jgi:hypothetical protein